MKFCCKDMKNHIECKCATHDNVFACCDHLLYYNNVVDEYGIIIHDGGSSYLHILYCPFCGTKLPKSKRTSYFDLLEGLKINPWDNHIPEEFKSDEWWKKRGL